MKMILIPGKSRNRDKGYVLIDVLITLLILSIVMTSILGGFSLIGHLTGGSWNRINQIIQDRNEFEKLPRLPE